MQDNGMGGRRIGKKYYDPDLGNVEEGTYYPDSKLTEAVDVFEKLIADYHKDKAYIKSQKRHWLPPRQRK